MLLSATKLFFENSTISFKLFNIRRHLVERAQDSVARSRRAQGGRLTVGSW
jgi:hypothetical protein